jgi:hypothetical protein
MNASGSWRIPEQVVKGIGLSADDSETIMAAVRHSTERLEQGVRPLCLDILHEEAAVDLLGVSGCKRIIESAANEAAVRDARRLVAEVRGGLREPLDEIESPSMLYRLYMALTAEGDLFEAELAKSFGPSMAEHLWRSFPCSEYTR